MSVEFLRETFGRQYTSEITGRKTAVRVYYCKLTAPVDNLFDVVEDALALSGGLPALGEDYGAGSALTGLVVVSHEPVEISKEMAFYQIKVSYESQTLNMAAPTARPWLITFTSLKEEFVPELTLTNSGAASGATFEAVGINEPILNKAGFPFVDPPVTDVKTKVVIELRKNFENINDIGTITNINQLMEYVNAVNDDASITIAGVTGTPLQFLMDDIQVSNKEENGETFYEAMFRVIFDPEWHVQKVLNAGWLDKNGKPIKFKGVDIQQPWPLDTNGDPLLGNAAARQAGAVYLGFCVKRNLDFSVLGLPTTF